MCRSTTSDLVDSVYAGITKYLGLIWYVNIGLGKNEYLECVVAGMIPYARSLTVYIHLDKT